MSTLHFVLNRVGIYPRNLCCVPFLGCPAIPERSNRAAQIDRLKMEIPWEYFYQGTTGSHDHARARGLGMTVVPARQWGIHSATTLRNDIHLHP